MALLQKIFNLSSSLWGGHISVSSAAGKSINLDNSLNVVAHLACIRANAQAVAQMPLHLFKEDANGGRVRIDHPLADVVCRSPNYDHTALEFWEGMVAWLLARGNAFALIDRTGSRVSSLTLLPAELVEVFRDQDGNLRYRYYDRGKLVELPEQSVFHIRGFGFGGDVGLDPIRYGAQTLGINLAAEEAAANVLQDGLTPALVWKAPVETTPEQGQQLKEILDQYTGANNVAKNMILPGIEPIPISINPDALQLLSSRRLNVELTCMLNGTPPAIIGFAAENTTQWGTGIEALQLQWLSGAINPIARRIEQRIRKQLLGPSDRGIYAEFNRESLLQMDSAAKANYISKMINAGNMTIAESRRKTNDAFKEGTDVILVNGNMLPLDKLGERIDMRGQMRNWLGEEEQ